MKNLFLALMTVISTAVWAQPGERDALTAEQRVDLRVKKMTLDLDLNEQQQKEIKALMNEQQAKFEKARETRKSERESVKRRQAEDRYKMRSEMLDQQIAHKAKMKKILSAEQFAKWEKGQERRHDKARAHIKKRHVKNHRSSDTPK